MPKALPKDIYVRKAKVQEVTDGDTVVLLVDLGCDIEINMKCRLDGVNAPEKNTAAGKVSKKWMEAALPIGADVTVQTVKDRREKYGRYLAVIYADNTGVSINDKLIKEGMAVEYHGEART